MTAIIGFHCFDGILMMADTEETTSTGTKSECDKIARFIFPHGSVITGGAGDSHIIECAHQELWRFMQAFDSSQTIHDQLSAFATNFWNEAIAPWAGFPSEHIPSFEMLIAVNTNQLTRLFRWQKNKIFEVPSPQHIAIGCGVIQIHPMLRDLDFAGNSESMLFCGMRIMFNAKRIVQGVGGKTESVILHNSGATEFFGTAKNREVEELVADLERFVNQIIYSALSNISERIPDLDNNVEKFLVSLPDIFRTYRLRYTEIIRPKNPFEISKNRKKVRKASSPKS